MTGRVLVLALVVGCGFLRHEAPAPTPIPVGNLHPGIHTELFLGRVRPDGDIVDDAAWQRFLSEVVTPRFPSGFTVIDAAGQYRGNADTDITRERAEVLIIVHAGTERDEGAIRQIIEAYKERFGQRAVLRVDTAATVGF